jgi:hypothetical protein
VKSNYIGLEKLKEFFFCMYVCMYEWIEIF